MSPDRWCLVEEILVEALKLPSPERAAFLAQACGSRDEILMEVESLLASTGSDLDLMDRPRLPPVVDGSAELCEGSELGPYRILRQIGSGGMGTVYMAQHAGREATPPVAIKLLNGKRGSGLARRLVHEQRVLASLEHPNVVRLLDDGVDGEGSPYFVMEYLDGGSIEHFCESRELSIEERLQLFVQVCSAVHFLHRSRILHRDLKPENVLVSADGVPKLLDFGVAQPLASEGLPPATTETGRLTPFTLSFASPEQLSGQAVTTATDVYSLGMVLYRILTGRHPFPPARSFLERLEQICREEPEEPRRGQGLSKGRNRPPLPQQLEGELERIVLKAIAKDPAQRQSSAQHLADELKQVLAALRPAGTTSNPLQRERRRELLDNEGCPLRRRSSPGGSGAWG